MSLLQEGLKLGKHTLLVQLLSFREVFGHKKQHIAVTATTALDTIPLGGRTSHSWVGIGKGDKDVGFYTKDHKHMTNERPPFVLPSS